jgi:hypothetical protein
MKDEGGDQERGGWMVAHARWAFIATERSGDVHFYASEAVGRFDVGGFAAPMVSG